jgi:hypothetical protein
MNTSRLMIALALTFAASCADDAADDVQRATTSPATATPSDAGVNGGCGAGEKLSCVSSGHTASSLHCSCVPAR